MLDTVLPEEFRSYVPDDSLALEWMKRGAPRASSVIVPWAVVLLDDADVSAARLAELICFDPRLASRALAHANAPRSTSASMVSTVDEALMRLGLVHARGFVLSETLPYLHVSEIEPGQREREEMLWKQSVTRAVIAREIVKSNRIANADEVYTCALVTSIIKQLRATLTPVMSARMQEAELEEESFLSVVIGTIEGWQQEWIQAAIEQSKVFERRKKSKFGQIIVLADACSEVLREEAPFSLADHPAIAKAASPLDITESNIQRALSSARKAVRTYLKRFGL